MAGLQHCESIIHHFGLCVNACDPYMHQWSSQIRLTYRLFSNANAAYAVLGLLSQKPRHGYETRLAFESLVGGYKNWEVKPAEIYTTLDRLEEAYRRD